MTRRDERLGQRIYNGLGENSIADKRTSLKIKFEKGGVMNKQVMMTVITTGYS